MKKPGIMLHENETTKQLSTRQECVSEGYCDSRFLAAQRTNTNQISLENQTIIIEIKILRTASALRQHFNWKMLA